MNQDQREEMIEWIEDFGSADLQLALALGVVDTVVPQYRTERIDLERAGWKWAPDYPAKLQNPSAAQLEALEAAQVDVPDAWLGFLLAQAIVPPLLNPFVPYATVPDPNFRNIPNALAPIGVLAAPFLWGFIWKPTGVPTSYAPIPPPHA